MPLTEDVGLVYPSLVVRGLEVPGQGATPVPEHSAGPSPDDDVIGAQAPLGEPTPRSPGE
jgi:hypothetical protein